MSNLRRIHVLGIWYMYFIPIILCLKYLKSIDFNHFDIDWSLYDSSSHYNPTLNIKHPLNGPNYLEILHQAMVSGGCLVWTGKGMTFSIILPSYPDITAGQNPRLWWWFKTYQSHLIATFWGINIHKSSILGHQGYQGYQGYKGSDSYSGDGGYDSSAGVLAEGFP